MKVYRLDFNLMLWAFAVNYIQQSSMDLEKAYWLNKPPTHLQIIY